MGLFNRKKKEDKLLPLPEFPRLPSEQGFPFYDEQVAERKEALPLQKPEYKKVIPSEDFSFEKKLRSVEREVEFDELTPRRSSLTLEKREDKPLFVKIDKYKESIKTIESIKTKLEQADDILKNLTKLRQDEEREIDEWQNSLNEIRQKLLKVDKELFEV